MKKIVLIGAGSRNFGLGTISDIFKSKVLEGTIITLHDINEKSLNNTKEIANKLDTPEKRYLFNNLRNFKSATLKKKP